VGKPYAEEIERLADTYDWAIAAPLGTVPRAARAIAGLPLVAVGSGGSFTTATFAAAIHRLYGSSSASVMTPLEAVSTPQSLRQAGVFLATAGGRNPDVIGAFERLLAREPKVFMVLCARKDSPLSRRATKSAHIEVADFELPSGKDGFLATNSLLASVVLLARGYATAFDASAPLPKSFSDLLPDEPGRAFQEVHGLCKSLWERQDLVVLYGPTCKPAAVDLESKLSEAALGTVQLADFRNFAHGRHHWLAKRGRETSVLSIFSDEDRALSEAMLGMIPKGIPRVELRANGTGIGAALSALVQVFLVVGSAGRARGIDPGDPGVPPFGRKIYHFRAFTQDDNRLRYLPPNETSAIERKSRASIATLQARGSLASWSSSYRAFLARLARAHFRGIVLDYDGTLCCEDERFNPLSEKVGRELNRLLRSGVALGIATGRGKSVKPTLREAIQPRFWKRVLVGYYNGGDIAPLDDDARPNNTEAVVPPLQLVATALKKAIKAPNVAKVTLRLPQITIEPGQNGNPDDLWNLVQHLIYVVADPGVIAVRSSHSIDVVAPGVSKRSVVNRIRELVGGNPETPILCVGDRGLWPGNDYFLLGTPHSLSVDEVSLELDSCWNLAEPGCRGLPATLDYLKRLEPSENGLRYRLE
jgi:fructoselysine-6-P-deglycase FrlB-like protein